MTKNMGTIDRTLRAAVAILVAILYFANQITGAAAMILGLFTIVFLLTSFVGFCPLYLPLKLSTKSKQG